MKCLEIARLQDFAPNTQGLLGALSGPQTPFRIDEPPSENFCLLYVTWVSRLIWSSPSGSVTTVFPTWVFRGWDSNAQPTANALADCATAAVGCECTAYVYLPLRNRVFMFKIE